MSAPRDWKLTSVRRADAGPSQSAMEIRCGSCGKRDHIINTGTMKITPPAIVEKKFAERGWVIGGSPATDRCPDCAAKLRAPKSIPKPELKLVTKEEPVVAVPAPEAEPPREMTREQRRVIFLKLEDVYLDEATGYDRGWSDKRVSEDLGVPRAWVAEIREQNFGPARDNEDVRELLSAHARIVREAGEIKADVDALGKRMTALLADVANLNKTADAIRKAVA